MISNEYRDLNRQLHDSDPNYGVSGQKFVKTVKAFANSLDITDILDYGCGKATLGTGLAPEFQVKNFDPAIDEHSAKPKPAQLVVCTDVLEHVEPKFIHQVLDDLARLSIGHCLVSIASRPAKKHLPDGRNAHLIQRGYKWWIPKIWKRFELVQFTNFSNREYILQLEPYDNREN